MNVPIQNSPTLSDALKARKAHLAGLLKIVDTRSGKATKVLTMTINLIRAELSLIDSQLKKRP